MIFYTSNHSPFQRGLSPTEPNLINSTNPYSNIDKTDESHHQSPPKTEDTSKENMRHHQNRLMKSGDIETNPGPRNPKKKTHITIILLVLITIIKIKFSQESDLYSRTDTSIPQINIHMGILLLNKKQRLTCSNKHAAYLALLLILAGDIHPRPGPPHPSESTEAIKCNQCETWTHTHINNLDRPHQWICPNPDCSPIYSSASSNIIPVSENKYSTISEDTEDSQSEPMTNHNSQQVGSLRNECPTETELYTKQLFKHLPQISSKFYIGKDICKICCKTVGENQRAVSCDECDRWLHIKCSDMESRTYTKFREKRVFKWTCHKCRHKEIPTTTRVNLDLLKPEEYPKTIEELAGEEEPFIITLNCRSIMNKIEELKHICYTLKPTIICLTETWMDYTVPLNFIVPEGYCILRKDRTESFKQQYGKANGGGIAILHKTNVKVKTKLIADCDEETMWIEVQMKRKFLLGLTYRASYTNLLEEKEGNSKLNKMLEDAHLISNNIIYLGDLNCDYTDTNPDKETLLLMETCSAYGLTQLINNPTRITDDCKTTIDHIWTDPSNGLIMESGTFIGISDHLGTYAKLEIKNMKNALEPPKIRRNWKNYKPDAFRETLQTNINQSNINEYIKNKDVNSSYNELSAAITKSLDEHAPLKEMKSNKTKKSTSIPWSNKEIEEMKQEKNNYLQYYYKFGNTKDKNRANKINTELTHLKEKCKRKYYTEKLQQCEGDSKQSWNTLKELTEGHNEQKEIEPDNMDQNKANQYNTYFATVGSEIQKKLNVEDRDIVTISSGFTFNPETEENTIKLIDRIRNDVAVGDDGINARVLKDGKHILAPTLTQIINLGYEVNVFPDQLKLAIVKPIHKKDCNNIPSNYRPISILPTISKVFERSAVNQLVTYLEQNNLLSSSQHAYRKGHSTVTCLAELSNTIYENLDKGLITGYVSMDLSKAFDAICHSLLLQKLTNIGLHKNAVSWVESYLHERKQKTRFTHATSEIATVTSGVPQGSILGPILFLIYTNELSNSFPDAKVISYADDTQFLVTGKTIEIVEAKVENLIDQAENWYKSNSLMSNPTKTEVLCFSPTRNGKVPIITCNKDGQKYQIKVREDLKILGVHIDSNMTWNTHLTKLRSKTIGIVKHMHRINKFLPLKAKLNLYNSLIASHFSYADVIWSGCSNSAKEKLQTVQNFAIKSILNRKKSDSATEALKTLKYLNLSEKRNIHEAVFVHKTMSGKMPKNITEDYHKLQPRLNHRSAENMILNIPAHKTSKYENSVLYRSVKTWNQLPTELKNEDTSTFKKKLQSHVTNMKYKTA